MSAFYTEDDLPSLMSALNTEDDLIPLMSGEPTLLCATSGSSDLYLTLRVGVEFLRVNRFVLGSSRLSIMSNAADAHQLIEKWFKDSAAFPQKPPTYKRAVEIDCGELTFLLEGCLVQKYQTEFHLRSPEDFTFTSVILMDIVRPLKKGQAT